MAIQDSATPKPFNSPIEVKTSRADSPVPVIEGIHLHSIYNPIKEAESLIQKYAATLEQQNKVLVLGLGFGYHVRQLEAQLAQYHRSWQIFVVEPDPRLVEKFEQLQPVELSRDTQIVSANTVSEFYDDMEMVHFMAEKPLVVAHPASFNLREEFFKNFMSFKASNKLVDVAQKIQNQQLREHILNLGTDSDDFDEQVQSRLNSGHLNSYDQLLGILAEMTTGAQA